MKRNRIAVLGIVVFTLAAAPAFAQSAKKERHIARIIGTIGGGFAGCVVGYLVSDDDALYATQKLTRNVVIAGAAGAVGGYFLGRTIDRHIAYAPRVDPGEIRRAQARQVDALVAELGPKLQPPPPGELARRESEAPGR